MKILYILFSFVFISFSPLYAERIDMPVEVIENGSFADEIELSIIDKMGYIKAADAAEIFNADFSYDPASGELTYTWPKLGEEKEVLFQTESYYVYMEGIKRRMMKCPLILEGEVYIPLEALITRAFQNVIEGVVKWNFSARTLWISLRGGIRDIRTYSYDNYSRFVVETGGELDFDTTEKRNGYEINFPKTPLVFPYEGEYTGDGVIDSISAQKSDTGVKFRVHTGEKAGRVNIKKLPAPPRVIMDVENTSPESKPKEDISDSLSAEIAMRERTDPGNIELVMIDPGHGGRDPGAIGAMGTLEKDVVLSIARKTANMIKQELNIRAELSRTGDYFLPLAQRTEIANNKGADVFISIHSNSSLNPSARGFEVYFLSERASDSEAEGVAARENSVVAMEERSPEKDRLTKILWSLTLNQFMNESSELASVLCQKIDSGTTLRNRGAKQAGFYVMKGARMPSILVEVGFLSNREDEKLLNSDKFQNSVAKTLTEALKEYRELVN